MIILKLYNLFDINGEWYGSSGGNLPFSNGFRVYSMFM